MLANDGENTVHISGFAMCESGRPKVALVYNLYLTIRIIFDKGCLKVLTNLTSFPFMRPKVFKKTVWLQRPTHLMIYFFKPPNWGTLGSRDKG